MLFAARNIHQRGFTLIELLVVITIIALLVGGGIAAYQRFNEKQVVVSATQQVISALRKIQKKASVGDKPTGCNGILKGYQYRGSSNGYSVYAQCNADVLIESQLLTGVQLNPTDFTVTINDLGRNTTYSSSSIQIRTSLYHDEVGISQTGEIVDYGIAAY